MAEAAVDSLSAELSTTDWSQVGCKLQGGFWWLLFWIKAVAFLFCGSLLLPNGKSVVGGACIWNKIIYMWRKDAIYAKLMRAQQQRQEQNQRWPRNSSSRIYRGGHRHAAVLRDVSLRLPFIHLGNEMEEWISIRHTYVQTSAWRASSSEHQCETIGSFCGQATQPPVSAGLWKE